ncbi:MAG: putative S-layer protein [archaeon]
MKKLLTSLLVIVILAVSLIAAADADLIVDSIDTVAGNPGDTVTVSVTVNNTGLDTIATVNFVSTDLVNGDYTIDDPTIEDLTDLLVGTSQTQTFDVTIPASDLLAGNYVGTLSVSDAADGTTPVEVDYTVTVNEVESFSLSETEWNIEQADDSYADLEFIIENTGSTVLDTWTIVYDGNDEDNDGELLTFEFTDVNALELAPGDSETVTVDLTIADKMDVDLYTGNFVVTTSTLDSQSISFSLQVEPVMCNDGLVGDLEVSIEDPDNGDDYKPGETIEINVKVQNDADDDQDVIVEAILYNLDTDEELASVESADTEIKDNDKENFNLDLEIPFNAEFDEGDNIVLYVRAYEDGDEDQNCDYETVELDLKRESHSVAITGVDFSQEEGLVCGDILEVTVEVENVGEKNEDDVYIRVKSSQLGIDIDSAKFDLGDYSDSDNDYKKTFEIELTDDLTAGNLYVEVIVYYDDGDEYVSELFELDVDSCSNVANVANSNNAITSMVTLKTSSDEYNVAVGSTTVTIPITVTNDGNGKDTVLLSVGDVSMWANVLGIEQINTLGAGDSYHAYIYLELMDGVTGRHSMSVTATSADGSENTELVTVNIAESAEVSGEGWFQENKQLLWILGDIILVLVALYFLRMLFKK